VTTIAVEDLRVEYGATTALDGVSFAVEDSDFFTLVGPSGCGKTTLLRTLAGFETPTSGGVSFDGEDIAGLAPEKRGVGVVFQNYALFPHMTVSENVGYGLRFGDPPAGASKRERVEELLELVDLDGMGERDPEALSGGQQQRVALARALAPNPRLLLLDEPMSALDAGLRERLRMQMKSPQSELGVTTVYVTQDQEEALAISDRVAVVRAGRIEQVGTPREVYHRPATRFVAEFVGNNNVFEGRVTGGSGSGGETEGSPASVVVDGTDGTFEVPTAATAGTAVTFCVRPGRLRVGGGENRFRARVESSEFLGDVTRVRLRWNDRPIVLRTTDRELPTGRVELGFDPSDAHAIGD
jgi:thiamine transport system ATP-binding protein